MIDKSTVHRRASVDFVRSVCIMFVQVTPLPTKPGISLIILKPIKILQREYIRCVRNEEECVCSAPSCCGTEQRSASQPVSCLTRLSAYLCHLAEGAYTIRLLFVSVSVNLSSHRIVGKCIGVLWRSECLLFANVLARTFQNMARRVQSCLEANGGHFQRML